MTESKTSEAQKKASKAYYEKNKERALMNNRRTAARTFVRRYATKEDMENLKVNGNFLEERLKMEKHLNKPSLEK